MRLRLDVITPAHAQVRDRQSPVVPSVSNEVHELDFLTLSQTVAFVVPPESYEVVIEVRACAVVDEYRKNLVRFAVFFDRQRKLLEEKCVFLHLDVIAFC